MANIRMKILMHSSVRQLSYRLIGRAILICFLCHPGSNAFSSFVFSGIPCHRSSCLSSSITSSPDTNLGHEMGLTIDDITSKLAVPVSVEDMILMASRAISDASNAGITRQIVRILLPRNPSSQLFGQFYEDDASTTDVWRSQILVPPDETWQGGIMQLYRAALPTCTQLLR
jgi:hypothetical protein